MKKYVLSTLLSCALVAGTSLRAEDPTIDEPPPPKEVGQAAVDGFDAGKQKNLGNIAIALLAVTVATVAILLVSKNQGKHA